MIRTKLTIFLIFLLVATSGSAQLLNPLKGVRILLDPGHGGANPGAVGPTGLKESETNLRVARYLRDLLTADGAEVHMTRSKDVYLTLGERVELAKKLKPDLFVSIHHNASLRPRKTNRSEIYYNALDQGLSQKAGKRMINELEAYGFGEESLIVPGGFFVLRNNPSPSVLTEGSYISIPHIEKQLKTGKALTNQAEALRRAIRETFAQGPLKINLFVSETPVKIDTPYFNFIFTANKPVKQIRARLSQADTGFGFDRLPPIGNTYRLYNTNALQSGTYDLQLTFYAEDGTIAPRINLPLQVELPFANSAIRPVAPFIPEGFKGKLPVVIDLRDQAGKLNTRSAQIKLVYKTDTEVSATSNSEGKTTVLLDLDGTETNPLNLELVHKAEVLARCKIPVMKPEKRFVIGRVMNQEQKGLEKVQIKYGLKETKTVDNGYFYLEYPRMYDNLELKVVPFSGYEPTTTWIKTAGEPVVFQNIVVKPVSQRLLGKKIGIMAPISFDNLLRGMVKDLMNSGAKISRLNMPENMQHPEYQAVLEVNLKNDYDLILSFKRETAGNIVARHYHRGGKGKFLADNLAFSLKNSDNPIDLAVMPGSDYEISHTGATSMVIAFPQMIPPDYPHRVISHLVQVLKSAF
jgi:N-acetylmuramoyl-L-alanine amidase